MLRYRARCQSAFALMIPRKWTGLLISFRYCRRTVCVQLATLPRATVPVKLLAVIKHDLIIFAITRPFDLPIGEITELLQLIERRTQRPLDERSIPVPLNVEKLAELVVPFFIYAFTTRGVEPNLQQRNKSLSDVILEFAVRFEIDWE